MQVLKAGTNQGAGTVVVGFSVNRLMVKATSGTATIKINTITIAIATTTIYDVFDVELDDFDVVTGNVDYVALG